VALAKLGAIVQLGERLNGIQGVKPPAFVKIEGQVVLFFHGTKY